MAEIDYKERGLTVKKPMSAMSLSGVCVVSLYDKHPPYCHGQTCFHSVRNLSDIKTLTCLVSRMQFYNGRDRYIKNKTAFVNYINYVLNDSVFSDCFCVKDAEWVYTNEIVIMNPNSPSNLMVSAMMMMRKITEQPYTIEIWQELNARGVNQDLAFFMSTLIVSNSSSYGCSYYIYQSKTNTDSFFPSYYMTWDCLKDWLAHKCKEKSNFKDDTNYYGLYLTFVSYVKDIKEMGHYDSSYSTMLSASSGQKEFVCDFMYNELKNFSLKVAKKKDANVFGKVTSKINTISNSGTYSLEDIVNAMVEMSKQIMERLSK